jgi:ABC-2 type transport system permease protein
MRFSFFLKFYGYLKKDFMLLYKRKKYLSVFILLPLIIGMLFILFINSSSYVIDVGVCNFDNSLESRQALEKLNSFNLYFLEGNEEECLNELKKAISSKKYSLGIEIPRDFSSKLRNLKQSNINIYYDNTDIAFSSLVSWKVDDSLKPFKRLIIDSINSDVNSYAGAIRYNLNFIRNSMGFSKGVEEGFNEIDNNLKNIEELESEFIVNPVLVNHRPLTDKDIITSAIAFVFPILAMFVLLMLSSTSILYDRKSLFITRVKSSTNLFLYLFAKLVFFFFLTLVQFIIIFGLFYVNGASYSFDIFSLIELIILVAVINSLIGFLIGIISDNEGIAVLFSLIIAFPLMLLSGIFYPIETLPRFISWIGGIMPLSYQINASKIVLLFDQTLSRTWIFCCVVLFLFVYYLLNKKI